MVENSTSGSGEGPGWATAGPTRLKPDVGDDEFRTNVPGVRIDAPVVVLQRRAMCDRIQARNSSGPSVWIPGVSPSFLSLTTRIASRSV
jgi:hypothetical protein